jgi:CubicO group peptidase (beta-lactamase class C family)
MILGGGQVGNRQVVPPAWLRASFALRLPAGDPQLDANTNYGYQWWLGSSKAGSRSFDFRAAVGDGGQQLLMMEDLDLVVVFTAGEYGRPSVGPELRRIFKLVVQAAVD